MTVTTPLREQASTPSEFDEVVSPVPVDSRVPDSARSAFDESTTRASVTVLIEEARKRARRRRLAIGVISAATVTIAAIALTASLGGGTPPSQGAAADSPAGSTGFGVFEPARGRIVYPVSGELRAIDPADPSTVNVLALPHGMGALIPAGWSADGTRLALASEHSGENYVMDAEGAVVQVSSGGGCCWFVTDPWLSPDGTAAIQFIGDEGDQLRLNDIEGIQRPRVITLDPPVGDRDTGRVPITAWSPDAARIAYAVYQQVGRYLLPSVYVVDVETGGARQMLRAGFGHIRQMVWSPDGSHLLVIAGPWTQTNPEPTGLNPMTGSKETGLYLVRAERLTPTDPAWAQPIALGHYVAATWSPDGAQIAAIDFAPTGRRLVVMSADGSASHVLTDLPFNDLFTGVAWHPGPIDR